MYVEGEYVSFIIGIAKDDRRPRYWRRPRGCTRRSPGGVLARVREVINHVRAHSSLRPQIDSLGVAVHERAGIARFADEHTIETKSGLRLRAEKIVICTGGVSRRLSVPGFELTNTHSDAWGLTSVPPSMLVVGAGATGVQVASVFNAFGSR